ncbi:hypothetical protein [Actinomycetospora sp. NBRC 106375]|uniref:hypothetical protein n=1 Tax=Actinomycetospora sp. NBRC 106375 TaxID=3032207 RepID=UPI0025573111|nr:hypothetical protein [Actinomycetospora sp. NBRC 106375]
MLVGLGVWLAVAVVVALVLARLMCEDRPTALELLDTHRRLGDERSPPEEPEEPDADVPTQRDGAHDDAETADRRGEGTRG